MPPKIEKTVDDRDAKIAGDLELECFAVSGTLKWQESCESFLVLEGRASSRRLFVRAVLVRLECFSQSPRGHR